MTFNSYKSGSVRATALGVFLTTTLGSTAMGEFYRHAFLGEWFDPEVGELRDSFVEEARYDAPEYVYRDADHPDDGYSIDIRQTSVVFRFSVVDREYFTFNEADFNGWFFTVEGVPDFDYLTIHGRGDVDWDNVEYGVSATNQFYVNFGTLGADQHISDGDSVRFAMSFVPAPAGVLALLGLGLGLVQRRRRA